MEVWMNRVKSTTIDRNQTGFQSQSRFQQFQRTVISGVTKVLEMLWLV